MVRKGFVTTLMAGICISGFANTAMAGGWASLAQVTKLEFIRGNGLMVFGNFGNVNSCTGTTGFFIKIDHPQYSELYSMAVTAMTTGMRLQPYVSNCQAIGWHGGTWNTVTSADAIYLNPAP